MHLDGALLCSTGLAGEINHDKSAGTSKTGGRTPLSTGCEERCCQEASPTSFPGASGCPLLETNRWVDRLGLMQRSSRCVFLWELAETSHGPVPRALLLNLEISLFWAKQSRLPQPSGIHLSTFVLGGEEGRKLEGPPPSPTPVFPS